MIARDNREAHQVERRRRESAGMAFNMAEPADEDDDGAAEVLDLAEELIQGEPAERAAGDGLTTESAARSMRDSLAALAMIAEPSMPPQMVRSGETSLEGLVRDMLRPMLAEWLDRNLPELVERLVKAEIARIAGKKG